MLERMLSRTARLKNVCNSWKHFSTVFAVPKISKQTERWNAAMQEASKLVDDEGNRKSALEKHIGEDRKANQLLQKLLSSNHPLVHSVQKLLYDTRLNFRIHSLISLLFAKLLGHTLNSPAYEESVRNDGITEAQRNLAEALELYRASFFVHTNVLNLSRNKDGELSPNLVKANGVGVLLGDFLAANASVVLSKIRFNEVLKIISSGVIDFTESSFYGEVDKNGNFLPDELPPLSLWQKKKFLSQASLLGKGCQSMAVLGGHDKDVQISVADYATNFALALQINTDLEHFKELSDFKPGVPFGLDLAPVIVHLDEDPEMVKYVREKGKKDINNLDFAKILNAVQSGTAEKRTINLMDTYISQGLKSLDKLSLPESNAGHILQEIIEALRVE